jgi:hypothetical protein
MPNGLVLQFESILGFTTMSRTNFVSSANLMIQQLLGVGEKSLGFSLSHGMIEIKLEVGIGNKASRMRSPRHPNKPFH